MIVKHQTKKLALSALAFFATTSFAGSKGFNVMMIGIGDETFRTSSTYMAFVDKENDSCWNKMNLADGASGLSYLFYKKRPPEMTRQLGEAIWNGDYSAVLRGREALHKHPKDYDVSEFHGLYIIKPEGNKISMMGVGINAGKGKDRGISQKIEIKLDPNDPKKSATAFEKGLCQVSKPFNIGFGV